MSIAKSENSRILNKLAGETGITRRGFMERASALGALSIAATIWQGREAKAQQVKGGHVRVGVGAGETSDTLEIGGLGGAHNQVIVESIRSKLVDSRNDGRLEPDLATEWEAFDKGKTWTFKLRKGVEFHNGKPLTPQDVIDSMNLSRGEGSTRGGASMLKIVEDIKPDGDNVVFKLSEAAADFPFYLAQNVFGIGPSIDGKVDESGVGTGPFVLEEFNPGVKAIGKRNPNYFKEGNPYFDSFEVLSVSNSATASAALVNNELDVIQPVDLKTASRLDATQGVSVLSVAGGSTITMPMHADKEPFSNNDFRLAMKFAIDREKLRDKVFYGHASVANDHPFPTFDTFYNPDIPQRQYDPDKAKFHAKKSGFADAKVRLHASDAAFLGSVDAGVLFVESAKKAGLNVEVVREPIDGYWSNVWSKVPFSYCYWGGNPTPDLILSLAYICDAAWGDTNWCDRKFTDLVSAARVELDYDKRKALYAEVQQILHDEGSTIVPLFQNIVHGISDKIDTGGEVLGSQPLDAYRIFKKWSFKA
jgi:peptide/nickel transport system substrate-binding protein